VTDPNLRLPRNDGTPVRVVRTLQHIRRDGKIQQNLRKWCCRMRPAKRVVALLNNSPEFVEAAGRELAHVRGYIGPPDT
jgi:hypothetical protein